MYIYIYIYIHIHMWLPLSLALVLKLREMKWVRLRLRSWKRLNRSSAPRDGNTVSVCPVMSCARMYVVVLHVAWCMVWQLKRVYGRLTSCHDTSYMLIEYHIMCHIPVSCSWSLCSQVGMCCWTRPSGTPRRASRALTQKHVRHVSATCLVHFMGALKE